MRGQARVAKSQNEAFRDLQQHLFSLTRALQGCEQIYWHHAGKSFLGLEQPPPCLVGVTKNRLSHRRNVDCSEEPVAFLNGQRLITCDPVFQGSQRDYLLSLACGETTPSSASFMSLAAEKPQLILR